MICSSSSHMVLYHAGSLTTVSTFIGELYALPSVPYAYIYAIASLGTAQAALILINGLHQWTA